jgi:hypothetical protein
MNPRLRGLLEWALFIAAVTVLWILLPYSPSP